MDREREREITRIKERVRESGRKIDREWENEG